MADLELELSELAEDSPLQEYYTKGDDGKYRLNAPGVDGLRQALTNSRKVEKSVVKELADLKKQIGDKTPTEEMQQKLDEAEKRVEEAKQAGQLAEENAKKEIFTSRIVVKLTNNDKAAKLLSEKVLSLVEIDQEGNATVSGMENVDKLIEHLQEEYPFLCIKESGAAGGRAAGGDKTGGAGNADEELRKLNPVARLTAARQAKQRGK